MNTKTQAPCWSDSSTELGGVPRWYCLSADGMATLCIDEEDAKEVAAESWLMYPRNGPYRAAQMVDASAISAERERCLKLRTIAEQVLRDMQAQGALLEWQTLLDDALQPNTGGEPHAQ